MLQRNHTRGVWLQRDKCRAVPRPSPFSGCVCCHPCVGSAWPVPPRASGWPRASWTRPATRWTLTTSWRLVMLLISGNCSLGVQTAVIKPQCCWLSVKAVCQQWEENQTGVPRLFLWPFIFYRTVQSWKEAEFAAWNRALGSWENEFFIWSWRWILVLNLMVTRVTEIVGQLMYFQMSFIIKIWKAVENEIIPVPLHHGPVEWTVVLYLRRFLLLAEPKGQIYISCHSKSRMCQWNLAIGKAAPVPKLWTFVCVSMQKSQKPLNWVPICVERHKCVLMIDWQCPFFLNY